MANTNVTMRIDETLKSQLQELMSNLGLDMTTFFTMAAKQAVREQALPFHPDMNSGIYGMQAYKLAMKNTNYKQLYHLRMNGMMKQNGMIFLTKDSFIFKIGNLHKDDLERVEDMYRKFLSDNGVI